MLDHTFIMLFNDHIAGVLCILMVDFEVVHKVIHTETTLICEEYGWKQHVIASTLLGPTDRTLVVGHNPNKPNSAGKHALCSHQDPFRRRP